MDKEHDVVRSILLGGLIVQLILVLMKVFKIVNWSWYIILLPIEIYFGIGIICCIIMMIMIVIKE